MKIIVEGRWNAAFSFNRKGRYPMNFFEKELRNFFGSSPMLRDAHYCGRTCLAKLDEELRVKLQFTTTGYADHYDAIKLAVINRTDGVVDQQLLTNLRTNGETLLHTAVFIELKAADMDKLRELQSDVMMELTRGKISVDRLTLRQLDGFLSVLPFGYNHFGSQYERVLPASSVPTSILSTIPARPTPMVSTWAGTSSEPTFSRTLTAVRMTRPTPTC